MNPSEPCILVVDDSRIERLKLSRALGDRGYAVDVADSGPLALDLLRLSRFDLVLLDLVMPEMNGYQVLEQIVADDTLRATPVVVVSGLDDAQSIQSCLQLGAKAHLAKPVDAESLRSCVEACLAPCAPRARTP